MSFRHWTQRLRDSQDRIYRPIGGNRPNLLSCSNSVKLE